MPRSASSYLCLLATLLLLVLGCTEAFSFLSPGSSRQSARLMARGPAAAAAAAAAAAGPFAAPRFPSLLVRQAATAAGDIDVRLMSRMMDGWANG